MMIEQTNINKVYPATAYLFALSFLFALFLVVATTF